MNPPIVLIVVVIIDGREPPSSTFPAAANVVETTGEEIRPIAKIHSLRAPRAVRVVGSR